MNEILMIISPAQAYLDDVLIDFRLEQWSADYLLFYSDPLNNDSCAVAITETAYKFLTQLQ